MICYVIFYYFIWADKSAVQTCCHRERTEDSREILHGSLVAGFTGTAENIKAEKHFRSKSLRYFGGAASNL